MVEVWVLFVGLYYGGWSMQEFNSEERCRNAITEMRNNAVRGTEVFSFCVKK